MLRRLLLCARRARAVALAGRCRCEAEEYEGGGERLQRLDRGAAASSTASRSSTWQRSASALSALIAATVCGIISGMLVVLIAAAMPQLVKLRCMRGPKKRNAPPGASAAGESEWDTRQLDMARGL